MRAVCVALFLVVLPAQAKGVRVRAHTTKSGTYVPAHVKTSSDSSKANNWSAKGNVNPYTGKKGTK